SFPATPRREWRDRASRNAAAGKWRAPGRKAGAPAPRSRARSGDDASAAPSWQHHRGDRARPERDPHKAKSRRKHAGAAIPKRRPFGQHVAHANRRMDGHGNDEGAVARRPNNAAARARENIGSGHSFAARIEDDGDVHQHQRHHERRGQPLPDVEMNVPISPLTEAQMVGPWSPAIEAWGLRRGGKSSGQDWCEWQAWKPPEAATACKRSAFPPSRTSFTSVHARLSAAGPR